MRTEHECLECALKAFIRNINSYEIPLHRKDSAMRDFFRQLADFDFEKSPPELGRVLHKKVQELINSDPYKNEKKHYNEQLLIRYGDFKKQVKDSDDPFRTALMFALSGNIIDFGMQESFDLEKLLERLEWLDITIDHSEELRKEIKNSESILYLGDNSGEIVFDKLFIETIKELFGEKRIWFAVRGGPIINDVTFEDALYVKMNLAAEIISNGYDAPGTILHLSSREFLNVYNKANLIISKGQGNFESLSGQNQNIFFLLMAKCRVVAKYFNAEISNLIVSRRIV